MHKIRGNKMGTNKGMDFFQWNIRNGWPTFRAMTSHATVKQDCLEHGTDWQTQLVPDGQYPGQETE